MRDIHNRLLISFFFTHREMNHVFLYFWSLQQLMGNFFRSGGRSKHFERNCNCSFLSLPLSLCVYEMWSPYLTQVYWDVRSTNAGIKYVSVCLSVRLSGQQCQQRVLHIMRRTKTPRLFFSVQLLCSVYTGAYIIRTLSVCELDLDTYSAYLLWLWEKNCPLKQCIQKKSYSTDVAETDKRSRQKRPLNVFFSPILLSITLQCVDC